MLFRSRDTAKFTYTLGRLYYDQGKHAQAESLLTRALGLYRRVLGTKDPTTMNAKLTLATLWLLQGNYEAAKPLLREALSDYQQLPDNWMRYRVQTMLGESLAGLHKYPVSVRRAAASDELARRFSQITESYPVQ